MDDPKWSRNKTTLDAVSRQRERERACMEPAPDKTGRTCDKPKGHPGNHWTYGGWEKEWPA